MWIEKIELINFKAYQKQIFTFPKPEQDRNLVLIGGKNGFGKTTLLEALYLCLYDKDAISHLGRAGLKEDSYKKFLQSALHGKTLIASSDKKMSVSVRFMEKENYGFEITRTWFFDSKGDFLDSDTELRLDEINNGIKKIYDKDELADILEIYAVPATLAPFFFFDGEEVKKLADKNREGWIKEGMESLMGVILLKNLTTRLGQYRNTRKPRKENLITKTELDAKLNSLTNSKEQLEKVQNEYSFYKEEIDKKTAIRNDLHNQLQNLGVGNKNIKNVADILTAIAKEKSSLAMIEKQLEKLLVELFPFYLVASNLKESLKKQLTREKTRLDWESLKSELEPRKQSFSEKFFETNSFKDLKNYLNDNAIKKLHDCIDNAWEMLYFPEPPDCADKILHSYLEQKQRQKLELSFSNKINAAQITELVNQKSHILQKLKNLESTKIKIESIDNDGVLNRLHAELKNIQAELDDKTKKFYDLDRKRIGLASEIHHAQAAYEKQYEKYKISEPAKSNADKAERVINLIQELFPRLFSLKINEVSQAVGKYYRQFSHKKQIANIDIQEDGSYRLFSEDNKEIKFDRSAGENEIFVTALFAGLAEVSKYNIPLVVDTPLARLDKDHRKNLLAYWCSDSNRQVILLSQDTEIDEQVMESLKPHLSKTYLLKSVSIGEGIYETTGIENAYFGDK